MGYDVIVVGAGVGGLFAAFNLSQKGKRVLLLERQPVAGGYATTFCRGGFTFESAVHCVDALGEEGDIREFLEDTGIAKKIKLINLKSFGRIIYPEHDFVIDCNRDNFVNFLKGSFPQEGRNIDRLFCGIDKFYNQFHKFSHSDLPLWLKLMISPLVYPQVLKASRYSARGFLKRYVKDEKLTGIISDIWRFLGVGPENLSALYFLIVFCEFCYKPTAYVQGGFSQIFKAMIEEMHKRGSEIKFNTTVSGITTKGAKVKSVVTQKGEEFSSRAVISNANAVDTLTLLIDDEKIRESYKNRLLALEASISAVQIFLGLSIPAKNLGMSEHMYSINTTYDQDANFRYSLASDYDNCSLSVVSHAEVDPSLVPKGKGSLTISALDSYDNWQGLSEGDYASRKAEMAKKLVARVEKYLPGLSKYIEVMEVGTPRTMQRYTLSPRGAIYGFAPTVKQVGINRLSQATKIKGLFLAGAWTQPGPGVHGCFISGIEAADLVLRWLP